MTVNKAIVVRDNEGQELKSFSFEDRDQAFEYLKQLEEWGVEAMLEEPSLPESLINALGASDKDRKQLKDSIDEEMDDHVDDSCCFSKAAPKQS